MIHDDGKADHRHHADAGRKAAFKRALPDTFANPVIVMPAKLEEGKADGSRVKQQCARMAKDRDGLGTFCFDHPTACGCRFRELKREADLAKQHLDRRDKGGKRDEQDENQIGCECFDQWHVVMIIGNLFGNIIGMGFPEPGHNDRCNKPGNPRRKATQCPDTIVGHEILYDAHHAGNQDQRYHAAANGAEPAIQPQNRRPAHKARQTQKDRGIMGQFSPRNAGNTNQCLKRCRHIAKQNRPAMADHWGSNGQHWRETHAKQKRCNNGNRHAKACDPLQEAGKDVTQYQKL